MQGGSSISWALVPGLPAGRGGAEGGCRALPWPRCLQDRDALKTTLNPRSRLSREGARAEMGQKGLRLSTGT